MRALLINCTFRLLGTTDLQGVSDLNVLGIVLAGKVGEEFFAAGNHGQQTAAGAVVLFVGLEVLGESNDAAAQESDLHFGGSGVAGGTGELGDDFFLVHFHVLHY